MNAAKLYRRTTATTRRRGPQLGSTTLFVEAQPDEMRAGEVVALAKDAGIELTRQQVHRIRWQLRRRRERDATERMSDAIPMVDELQQLRRLIFRIGTVAAQAVWQECERTVMGAATT